MKNLIYKEMKLAASPLSYIFIAFGVMAMIPGYPILLSAFFICFGIFHSFQTARENNDILYTLLLPVNKLDTVKAKYVFTMIIQLCGLLVAFIFTMVRMLFLADAEVYVNNALMNANQVFLAWVLVVYTAFNLIFVRNFFKSAYKIGIPFLKFGIATFIILFLAEAIHFVPGFSLLNETDTIANGMLWGIFGLAFVIYFVSSFLAMKSAMKHFEKVDM